MSEAIKPAYWTLEFWTAAMNAALFRLFPDGEVHMKSSLYNRLKKVALCNCSARTVSFCRFTSSSDCISASAASARIAAARSLSTGACARRERAITEKNKTKTIARDDFFILFLFCKCAVSGGTSAATGGYELPNARGIPYDYDIPIFPRSGRFPELLFR